ncbi:cytosol aminopeptidase-like [Chrysoperla carnea]|uniref:cytosol aminopeptidase-like n=1 Tax=Chrysoperla carnea TaxID=189513 RepID=UPI001D067930|nr:cytosol aminopeptidase-like [Chrysoperla carnea]
MSYFRPISNFKKINGHAVYKKIIRKLCDAGADKCPTLKTPEKKGIILGVYEGCNRDPVLSPACSKFNDKLNGKLGDLIAVHGSLFERGQCRVFNNLANEFWGVAVVGLGPKTLGYNDVEAIDEAREAVRAGAAMGARKLQEQGIGHILVEGFGAPEHAAEGSALAVWKYQENKARQKWIIVPTLELHDDTDHDAWQRGLFKAEAQNLARRLSDTPANQMTPTAFAQQAVNVLCPCGIKVEVHDKDWIESKKLNALLTAARGSCEPPVFIEMTYCGGPSDQKPICLVGKGVTFDSGGICIKTAEDLKKYRADMTGAATVVAVIRAASALSLPLNIIGIAPMAENMPSGMAVKPGDIVFAANGKSIAVEHTDHEGQLILADTLVYTQLYHKPRMIIDIASISTGIRDCFGTCAAGVFSNNEQIWQQLSKASVITGDRVWRLPLWEYFRHKVTDFESHDVNNLGKGDGEPCMAAGFLSEFIECMDWAHIDVSGVGKNSVNDLYPYYPLHRMTGRPTRTLIQFLYQMACPQERDRELK